MKGFDNAILKKENRRKQSIFKGILMEGVFSEGKYLITL